MRTGPSAKGVHHGHEQPPGGRGRFTRHFINVFEIDAGHVDAFVSQWEKRAALMRDKPGFIDSRLHRARSSQTRYQLVNVAHWESQEAWEAATADQEFQDRTRAARDDARTPITASPALYDVAVEFSAATEAQV